MSESRDRILEAYIKVCREASVNDDVFNKFKSIPEYREVLEHLSHRLGQKHLDLIQKNNPLLLTTLKFFDNDKYGSPSISNYELEVGYLKCSPTTLQYISVVSNLIDNFKSLDDMSIIEIGGGYGGQCKIIQDVFNIKKYAIIDLGGVIQLQSTYLHKLNCINKVSVIESTIYKYLIDKSYDLFISNYALSEVSEEDQLDYINELLLNCKHGYITCNQPLNGMELLREKFSTFKISKDIEGERETNYLITW